MRLCSTCQWKWVVESISLMVWSRGWWLYRVLLLRQSWSLVTVIQDLIKRWLLDMEMWLFIIGPPCRISQKMCYIAKAQHQVPPPPRIITISWSVVIYVCYLVIYISASVHVDVDQETYFWQTVNTLGVNRWLLVCVYFGMWHISGSQRHALATEYIFINFPASNIILTMRSYNTSPKFLIPIGQSLGL